MLASCICVPIWLMDLVFRVLSSHCCLALLFRLSIASLEVFKTKEWQTYRATKAQSDKVIIKKTIDKRLRVSGSHVFCLSSFVLVRNITGFLKCFLRLQNLVNLLHFPIPRHTEQCHLYRLQKLLFVILLAFRKQMFRRMLRRLAKCLY
jgi:hypothetical protein